MVLDLVTYLCMMSFFAGFVLLNDEEKFDWTEIVFAFYVVVSAPFRVLLVACAIRHACVHGFCTRCICTRCSSPCKRLRAVLNTLLTTRLRLSGENTKCTLCSRKHGNLQCW